LAILAITICAVICEADSWVDVHMQCLASANRAGTGLWQSV
jgi:hypothetical protein